jgi:predicted dehydrogenase
MSPRRGAQRVKELGKVLNFRIRMQTCIQEGSKYIETPWRKAPEYQGGFLLDGGVHFIAGMRLLLGSEAKATSLSAFTAQHQSYLPPVDTADATIRLKNGGQGTLSLSFGTTATGNEWVIACEGGEVIVQPFEGLVTVKAKGETEGKTEEAKDEFGGVKQEVFAWAQSIMDGKADPQQSPEEALGDLELLEALIKSGQRDGIPVNLYHQT